MRIGPQPLERIDRSQELTFSFDGRPVRAYAMSANAVAT